VKRIKELREERGITQMRLAEMAGITQAALSNLEAGKQHNPQLGTLRKLAEALDAPLITLLEEQDGGPPGPKEIASEERLRRSLRALLPSEPRSLFLAGVALKSGVWVAGTAQRDLAWLKSFATDHEVEPAEVLEVMYKLWPDLRALQQKYVAQAKQVPDEVNEALGSVAETA
jgi:transcriptional regulator with XRE-family HTH domain